MPINLRYIMDAIIEGQTLLGIESKTFILSTFCIDDPKTRPVYHPPALERSSLRGYLSFFKRLYVFLGRYIKLLLWADVVHWQFSNRFWSESSRLRRIDFALLRLLRKPAIVQFHGSDIRENKKRAEVVSWWSEAFDPEFAEKLDIAAARTQREFAKANFVFAVSYGMFPSIWPENLERSTLLERSVDMSTLVPCVHDDVNKSPVVIMHSPSSAQVKGTKYVLAAIEEIGTIRDIEFVLLQDLPRDEVIERLGDADIVVDQLLGENYGLASVEALARGSVSIANLSQRMRDLYPSDLPIVSANPDTIKEVLLDLIDNPQKRIALARQGYGYVEHVHSFEATIPQTLEAYRLAAQGKGRRRVVKRINETLDHHTRSTP